MNRGGVGGILICVCNTSTHHIVFGEEKSKSIWRRKEQNNDHELKKGTKKHNETGEHDIKNHRKLQIPRGNNKPQEIYEKTNIRIKKKGRGGTPNHPHYSWGPHLKRHTNGNYMETKAKQINTRGSRRRAHHFFLPHQLFFFLKKK